MAYCTCRSKVTTTFTVFEGLSTTRKSASRINCAKKACLTSPRHSNCQLELHERASLRFRLDKSLTLLTRPTGVINGIVAAFSLAGRILARLMTSVNFRKTLVSDVYIVVHVWRETWVFWGLVCAEQRDRGATKRLVNTQNSRNPSENR
jgi:hypothetical protein